jgi:peptide/nickel transport system ATP-binding protein
MGILFEAKNVTKIFGGGIFNKRVTKALDKINFVLDSGSNKTKADLTAIAGESGSGKTTLARLLLGVIKPDEGEILYQGQDVAKMKKPELREFRREVQPIFQDPFEVYNPFYKVDHVLYTPINEFKMSKSKTQAKKLVGEALEMVGLRPDETLGRFPHQLSGGQRQRIMVARALLLEPKVILADEPVSMVDASLRATILESLKALNREKGIAIVYISHDLATVFQICDKIMVLFRGIMVEWGSVEKVIGNSKHPYTKLLVGSIPRPNPETLWDELDEKIIQDLENEIYLDPKFKLDKLSSDHYARQF